MVPPGPCLLIFISTFLPTSCTHLPACPGAPYNVIQERSNYSDPSTLATVATTAGLEAFCYRWLNQSVGWRNNLTTGVQKLLIDTRLGDQRVTGKIALRNQVGARAVCVCVVGVGKCGLAHPCGRACEWSCKGVDVGVRDRGCAGAPD